MKKHHCINLRWPLIFLPLDLHTSTIGFRAVEALGKKITEQPLKWSSIAASWKRRQPSPMQSAKHAIALQTHWSDQEISSFTSAFEGSVVLALNLQKAMGGRWCPRQNYSPQKTCLTATHGCITLLGVQDVLLPKAVLLAIFRQRGKAWHLHLLVWSYRIQWLGTHSYAGSAKLS